MELHLIAPFTLDTWDVVADPAADDPAAPGHRSRFSREDLSGWGTRRHGRRARAHDPGPGRRVPRRPGTHHRHSRRTSGHVRARARGDRRARAADERDRDDYRRAAHGAGSVNHPIPRRRSARRST